MRSFISALALTLGTISVASAQGFSLSTTIGYESRYVFRGVQFAETSIQPAVNLSYGNFYGGAWFNLPIGDDDLTVTPGGEELDLFVGYSTSITKTLSYDVGVTYYTFPDLASGFFDLFEEDGDGLGSNTIEAYAGLSLSTALSPSFYVYRDFNFDTVTVQGSISHSIPVAGKTSLNLGATLGYVIDDTVGGDYLYGTATANISYAFSSNNSVNLGVRYGGSDINGGSIIDDSIAGTTQSSALWWGIGFSSTF